MRDDVRSRAVRGVRVRTGLAAPVLGGVARALISHADAPVLAIPDGGGGFTGYSLVYEQLSYWGAIVGANITASVPIVGDFMKRLMLGGGSTTTS